MESLINQKQGFTTTDVSYIDGTFFVKLRVLKIENLKKIKLPLNEDDTKFE